MQIIDYFKYCSWKFAKENDLSDITWAMCMSSEVFRDSFLLFFFPNMVIEKDILIPRIMTIALFKTARIWKQPFVS